MKDKIRLILLNDWLYGGGAERSMAVLANELAKDTRYEIYLVLLENKISFELNSGIKCISFRNSYKFGVFQKFITILLDVFRLIGLIKNLNIDVVLSFQHRSNIINCLSKLLFKKFKSIISERIYTKDFFEQDFKKIFFNNAIKALYNKADAITCNSADIKEGLAQFYNCDRDKITVIENAYDTKSITRLGKEEIETELLPFFREKEVIVNVGRLDKQKGHEYLIKAFAMLPNRSDYCLFIIGEGSLHEYLERLISELGLSDSVFLLGYRKNPYKYLSRANIFAFTSLYEGYPNALAEAMVFDNLKIISFDFKAGSKELIGNDEYGKIVRKYDIVGLSQAILDAKNSKNVKHKTLNSMEDLVYDYKKIIE